MIDTQPTPNHTNQHNHIFHPHKSKKKKGGKFKKVLFIGLITSPFILFFLTMMMILIMAMVIFLDIDDDGTTLSEYGALEIPEEFIPIYQEVAEEYEIDWILLAAIHRVETNFSTIEPMISPVGAIGHFQFMPCTVVGWSYPACQDSDLGEADIPYADLISPVVIAEYGGYGVDGNGDGIVDMFDIYDATYTAGNYLSSHLNGRDDEEALRNAIYAYNHADWYVDDVLYYYSLYADGFDGANVVVEIFGDKAWIVPFTKNITSEFGVRVDPFTGVPNEHNGIDIAKEGILGRPVVAFTDGEIIYSQYNQGGYGYLVIIQHENNMKTYYAHLNKQGLPVGTKVKAGQVIGSVGSTGRSTGAHLHFEIRINDVPVNPMPYLSEFLN